METMMEERAGEIVGGAGKSNNARDIEWERGKWNYIRLTVSIARVENNINITKE